MKLFIVVLIGIINKSMTKKCYFIRVKDGNNFKNSKYPFWGVKRGKNGCIKGIVNKIKEGDILCFITSKDYGGKVIGICKYTCYYDRNDEPLVSIHTCSNNEQNWKGDEDWDIQIHYTNLYMTEKLNMQIVIQNSGIILDYEKYKSRFSGLTIYEHYKNLNYYTEPKIF